MNNLKLLRVKNGKTQKEVADFLKIQRPTYTRYEIGDRQPDNVMLTKLADYFGVTVDYLIGRTEHTQKPRKKGIMIPVLGRVQAGIPLEAVEEIIDYEEIEEEMASQGECFALQVTGNSMEPRIKEYDVVIVRKQDDVISGEVAVVLVNGTDATLKQIKKQSGGIYLIPYNPSFEVKFYTDQDIQTLPIKILGKVIELRGKF